MRKFFREHFVFRFQDLARGKYHTLLTYSFHHDSLSHLFPNMLSLHVFGSMALNALGWWRFLLMYAGGTIAGAGAEYVWQLWQNGGEFDFIFARHALVGASGAVFAVLAFSIARNRRANLYLFGLAKMRASTFGLAILGYETFNMLADGSHTAHAGHLGGAALGLLSQAVLQGPFSMFRA